MYVYIAQMKYRADMILITCFNVHVVVFIVSIYDNIPKTEVRAYVQRHHCRLL